MPTLANCFITRPERWGQTFHINTLEDSYEYYPLRHMACVDYQHSVSYVKNKVKVVLYGWTQLISSH